jgi:hypothetical protein
MYLIRDDGVTYGVWYYTPTGVTSSISYDSSPSLISLTSTSRARPVPAALAFFTGASQFEEPTGAISAAAVVVTVPVVILVLLFQRQIVSGLTQGAVKG